jgi:hypothetical protein
MDFGTVKVHVGGRQAGLARCWCEWMQWELGMGEAWGVCGFVGSRGYFSEKEHVDIYINGKNPTATTQVADLF